MKINKLKAEMTQDGDSNEWGLIIWTGIKDKKKANKKADELIKKFNAEWADKNQNDSTLLSEFHKVCEKLKIALDCLKETDKKLGAAFEWKEKNPWLVALNKIENIK